MAAVLLRILWRDPEEVSIKDLPLQNRQQPAVKLVTDTGAVVSIFLAVPSQFIGIFGVASMLSGEKIVGGLLGTIWAYFAATGAYELNRRKHNWVKGTRYRTRHLVFGLVAVNAAMIVSGAIHELLFVFALAPGMAAVLHANADTGGRYLFFISAVTVAVALGVAIWLYVDTNTSLRLTYWFETLP